MSGKRPEDENGESTVTGTGERDAAGEPGDVDGGPPVADGGVRLQTLLRALSDQRRRFVLYYLRDRERAELEELTDQLAAWEAGQSLEALAEPTREDLQIELAHVHLPKLDELGLIRYEDGQRTTYLRELPAAVESVLDYCATFDVPDTTNG